ncbi:F-box/kelch-repeat protein At1g23390-like [Olea europaea var. sylvestris]|uniref:F-box kelch-repeat At1g23390 n=1 Tax=Olea europaea subsp. europaea TaxID=158383 RepID=A0A8S0UBW7_OLEEU|nr:F-box/kelch-repeat protein At1g23390-like [Olea europaea var. sylvestris]CAA3014215.1 F-box kelch-repeat At1g23390 [Olea europaea subsp. europaea]
MARIEDQEPEEDEPEEIHGDILEVIFSHVPLIDLVAASRVCKSWCCMVKSSLRHLKKPKPWLILHSQATRHPYNISMHAYDPRSHVWMKMVRLSSIKGMSSLKSSHSNFIYNLSSLKLSFSFDPLNLTWSHVHPPFGWRNDPIVARVGDFIIVAGGGCDYGSDQLPVEIYNIRTGAWHMCDNIPGNLRDLPASIYLSIATTNEKLFVTEKQSGLTYWFDLAIECWSEPYSLKPGQPIVNYNIGTSNDDLVLVGLFKDDQNAEQLKIWKVVGENFQFEEICEMPCVYVDKLKSKSSEISSVNACVVGNFVFIYNPLAMEEIVMCELIIDDCCRWWSIQNVVAPDKMLTSRLVFSCSEISVDELQRVMRSQNRIFLVES